MFRVLNICACSRVYMLREPSLLSWRRQRGRRTCGSPDQAPAQRAGGLTEHRLPPKEIPDFLQTRGLSAHSLGLPKRGERSEKHLNQSQMNQLKIPSIGGVCDGFCLNQLFSRSPHANFNPKPCTHL